MSFFRHHFKILDSVVGRITVDVMNHFVALDQPSESLFDHQAMFHHVALGVGVGMIRNTSGPICSVLSVADQPAFKWFSGLSLYAAFERAVFLSAFASTANVGTACSAFVRRCFAPAMPEITDARTECARLFATILRMESLSAVVASQGYGCSFHAAIIPRDGRYCKIEEKYCELAANRLQQQVLF